LKQKKKILKRKKKNFFRFFSNPTSKTWNTIVSRANLFWEFETDVTKFNSICLRFQKSYKTTLFFFDFFFSKKIFL